MKKSILFLFLSIFLWTSNHAQTKVISHKSHSGNKADFKAALNAGLFDISASNFGIAPMRIVRDAQLDSLIHLTDTSAIMVTSEVCWRPDRGEKEDTQSIWEAGKDTLDFHPLFTKKHSLDSIKKVLKEQYNFQNPVDSIVFIGYDNEKPKSIESQKKTEEKASKKERRKKRKLKRKERRKVRKKFVDNATEEPQVVLASQNIEEPIIKYGYSKGLIILGLVLLSVLVGFVFYKK